MARACLVRYNKIFHSPEKTGGDLNKKIGNYWKSGAYCLVNRVLLWRELGRLEHIRGKDLLSAVYRLRVIRLLGGDRFGDLPYVVDTLRKNGFHREALVADAMYGKYPDRDERCAELLNEAYQNNRFNQNWEFEFIDDRRKLPSYKVSIVVSLYNAAAKLTLFLKTLQLQTIVKAGKAEVILIDSGSPDNEYAVFKQVMKSLETNIVYARSARRETIQCAWNRGISLSLSPYLAFLGVDENLSPDCLEILVGEMDKDVTLDWVIGNSVVTDVDEQGAWKNDVMVYNRDGLSKNMVYLETCYISWVGALYRKSVHSRFGFYDPTFAAAGDTEFKNRILPFIKIKHIPKMLGFFWNYPEARTTHSPLAEIEDLRAWYLHRTLAGIKYAFQKRDPKEAEDLFYTSLCYRKSYRKHWSTDIEYAYTVLNFLQENVPVSSTLKYFNGIKKLLNAYRSLDFIQKRSKFAAISALLHTKYTASQIEKHHLSLSNRIVNPQYKIFNDNRYEQHSNTWTSNSL
ncbi:MAG: glycosyltransferase family 2 protein [Nitrospirota bacterium]